MVDLTNKKESTTFKLNWVILQDDSGFFTHCSIIKLYISEQSGYYFWSPPYIPRQKSSIVKQMVTNHVVTTAKSTGIRREDQAELYCFVRYFTVVTMTPTRPPNNMAVRTSYAQTMVAISPSSHEAKG